MEIEWCPSVAKVEEEEADEHHLSKKHSVLRRSYGRELIRSL
jgi:hypothetical protein